MMRKSNTSGGRCKGVGGAIEQQQQEARRCTEQDIDDALHGQARVRLEILSSFSRREMMESLMPLKVSYQ